MFNLKYTLFVIVILLLLINTIKSMEPFYVKNNLNYHLGTYSLMLSAKKKNLKYKILENDGIKIFKNDKILKYWHGQVILLHLSNRHLNEKNKKFFFEDKINTTNFLNNYNVPVPKTYIKINKRISDFEFNDLTKKVEYPCVIKQTDSEKGKNVFINIKNKESLINKFKEIKKTSNNILVEDYLEGKNYRIYVIDDKLADVCMRGDVFVIGDNEKSIDELIEQKNNINSVYDVKIKINTEYVKTKYKSLNYIPRRNEKVILNPIGCLANGAIPRRIPFQKIHPDNIKLFKQINKLCGLRYCGIDFITPDIQKSFKEVKCGINELNTRSPSLEIHYLSDLKFNTVVSDKLIENFL
jgi:D-alanine-D-alanine ligase-like ATP-grasp enzyme